MGNWRHSRRRVIDTSYVQVHTDNSGYSLFSNKSAIFIYQDSMLAIGDKLMNSHIRIFPHKDEIFKTKKSLKFFLLTELKKNDGIYHITSLKGIKSVPAGSIVLFRKKNKIVGEAIVKEDIKKINSQDYEGIIRFEPSSIRVYSEPIDIEKLQEYTDNNLNYGQAYHIIEDWSAYQEIIKSVGVNGFW